MSDNKKQKGNWCLLFAVVVAGSLTTIGAFKIYHLDSTKVKNFDLGWSLGQTKILRTNTETDKQKRALKITSSEQTQSEKTLWDWLDLSSRLAIPILLAVFGYQVQKRDKKREKEQQTRWEEEQKSQAKLERELTQDNLAEEAIQAYLDNMAQLLLNKEYRKELFSTKKQDSILFGSKDNFVRDIVRTQTITILRRLESDKKRQDRIIHFLRDAELYEFIFENANLSKANLQKADLYNANLTKANLYNANLQESYLYNANLQEARLWNANLQKANLCNANLTKANLCNANLHKARLWGANLTFEQIKSACFWDRAIHKGKWDWNQQTETWIPKNEQVEQDNAKFIEELRKDKLSDPKEKPDCSRWEE